MRGDFDEDEDPDFEPEWDALDEEDCCVDCQRFYNCLDECGVCGSPMCFACFEMGCGVCKGPHADEPERERDDDDGRTYADPRDERDERARR